MAGNGNFIKLDRKILDWQWYSDPNTKAVFLHCLLRANWKDGKWKNYEYKRGQFITSLSNLATDLKLTIRQTRTALARLESTGELTSWADNKVRIITVNNYDLYQGVDKQNGRQTTSKRQATRQSNDKQNDNSTRKNTTYSIKEEKEDKERASAESCPSGEFETDPDDYLANYYKMRGG